MWDIKMLKMQITEREVGGKYVSQASESVSDLQKRKVKKFPK